MVKKNLISEYKAAVLTAMSPELLRWLTTHAPKHGIKRKIKVEKVENETFFFDEKECLEFNTWLKEPWPAKDGRRPHIPAAIRREIKDEANGACAICHSHMDTCEAAHLEPVAKTYNNHPENLLWLCANHHTSYDNGLFGPDKSNVDFVASFKNTLRSYRVMLWRTQHEVSHKLFFVLGYCNDLQKQLEAAKTEEHIKTVEKVAKETLAVLPALASESKTDPKYAICETIYEDAISLSKDKSNIVKRLGRAQRIREDYVAAFGFVKCPLCEGTGQYEGIGCPVCNGDREIEQRLAEVVDLRAYEYVDCPVCEGQALLTGEFCPACGGEARMARRYADGVDVRDYEDVACPLCEGAGRYEDRDCPECGGEGNTQRRFAETIDLDDYKKVDCPVCDGQGTHNGTDCPACHGEAQIDRRDLDRIDVRDYEDVTCPLCEGAGRYEDRDCPECGGEGNTQRRFAETTDLDDYKKVDCPVCDGQGRHKGGDCPACDGEARIDRRDLDSIDVRDYEEVSCPLCEGRRYYRGNDCPACDGEGDLERRFADRIDPSEFG